MNVLVSRIVYIALGAFFLTIGLFIIKKKSLLKETAKGHIVGYGTNYPTLGDKQARTYRVKYLYNGNEYYADSIESKIDSKLFPRSDWDDNNFNQCVTIRFNSKHPEVVSIVDLQRKWLELLCSIIGVCLLIAGIII